MERSLDWRAFANRLVFCYGCGRFGLPMKGVMPRGWTMLYQPHEGPVGLHVCSDGCKERVRLAMIEGPVLEPLESALDIMMSSEMRERMMAEAMEHALSEEGLLDRVFAEAAGNTNGNDEEES